jgi:murein L,D-transpeptidase YcbB/YkuD
MRNVLVRRIGSAVVLAVLLVAGGCRKHRKTTSAPNTDAYADKLHGLVAKKALPPEKVDTAKVPNLRWPDFSDYQAIVTQFYDDRNFEVAWTRDGAPTAAATGFMQAFASADAKGLIPEDYDAPRWAERVAALKDGSPDDAISLFDVAMTVNVMRYISDLRIGRVNPTHFNFGINVADKKYDLAEFVSDNAVDATDVPKLIVGVEPNSEQYRNTEQALGRYIELAKQQAGSGAEPLPTVAKALSVGQEYPAVDALLARLQVEGDLPANAVQPKDHLYDAELSTGVKSFQHRHGIADDGKLTVQTIASMNVPLTARVTQLQNSLERWRWLPDPYLNAPLIVNLPEFVLHGYTPDHKPDFTMKVVVGKVIGEHETPVFAQMMKYLVFRPYWNVPVDIARKELAPHVAANQGYLASKNFEVTDSKGSVLTSYTAKQVAQGGVMVREKPGAGNSLGLVKFMFPNEYSIYLHSTPATQLFEQSRRDFSHGCVRVQKPDELAAWVLQGQGGDWDLAKVQAAMKSGPDNRTVSLKTPIPIVIFYVTGLVEDDGHVHFFDDIYGYDSAMQKVLQKGPPYPVEPAPAKARSGDTT